MYLWKSGKYFSICTLYLYHQSKVWNKLISICHIKVMCSPPSLSPKSMKLETDVLILYFESELLTSIDHVSLESSNTGFAWAALAFRHVTRIHEVSILIYLTKDTAKNLSILYVWQAALSHPMPRYLLWHFLIKIFSTKTLWHLRGRCSEFFARLTKHYATSIVPIPVESKLCFTLMVPSSSHMQTIVVYTQKILLDYGNPRAAAEIQFNHLA